MAIDEFINGYALIIAVNENLIPNYALPSVAKDAAALYEVLIHPKRCAYPKDNVRLLTGTSASREGIQGGLNWLKERLAADGSDNTTAVLYYSGHGAYNPDDKSYYFLPYDLSSPIADSLLPATDIADEIEQVRPRRLVVILDCCHAGGMGIKGEDLLDTSGLVKSAAPPQAKSVVALMTGQGRAVLSSSTAAESSYVRADRSMSIFTYHLVEALTGYAQSGGEPSAPVRDILVSDVMSYVSRAVPASARTEYDVSQTPVYQFSGENFPVARLLGGEGLSKGRPLPDPLAALPASGPAVQTGGGAYVGGSVNAGGNVNLGQKTVGGDEIGGSKYVMSGDFRGAILNVESQLSNVTQSILSAPGGSAAGRADLNSLVAALQFELERAPAERAREVEAVATRLANMSAALETGDSEMAEIGARALERAADALGDARPGIPAAAKQIVAALKRILN